MKRIVLLLIAFTALTLNTFAQGNEDMEKARKAFKALMENAHPSPAPETKPNYLEVPFAEPVIYPFFTNYSMIEYETDSDPMQNESSIAVNPLNPKMLIGSSVDYRENSSTWVYFSEDGAKTWANYSLGHPFPNWRSTNDPSVAYDPEGNAYLVYGGFGTRDDTSHGESFGENGVFISISTDGGRSWDSSLAHIPVILHKGTMTMDSLFEDKYYISVDNSSTSEYNNHLYIPWKRVTPRDSATQIVFTKSIDKGRTWAAPIPVSPRKSGTSQDTTYGQSFPLVATGPYGEVYVIWNDGIEHGVGFNRSFNGGETFEEDPRIIQRYNIFGITNNIANNPNDEPVWRHTLKEVVRSEAYPVIVVDTTQFENRGTLYLTWAADNIPNIYFSKSIDSGTTWSEPVVIHSDPANDQFWQWMAVDPMNGDIAVMYLDSRDDPENIMVECYVSYSSDGGETWTDRRISDFNSDIRQNPFFNHFAGDYSGMAFFDGYVYPSWVDMRNAESNIKDSDVFTAIINVWAPAPVDNFTARANLEEITSIDLNWEFNNEYAFGQPMGDEDFHFLLKRGDENIDIPATERSYKDTELTAYEKYYYELYVVANDDTSIVRIDSSYAGGSRELAQANLITVEGNEENEIIVLLKLPEYRADGFTPLVNLDKVVLYDGFDNELNDFIVDPETAGTIVKLTYQAEDRGYYDLKVKLFDSEIPANESAFSNELHLYTGRYIDGLDDYEDNFDNGFMRYKYTESWNTTTDFYYSAPACLTDSPEGNYKKMIDNHLQLIPIDASPGGIVINISFWHAALLYKRDSAKVEMSLDTGKTWVSLASYNQTSYDNWEDGVLDEQDWKHESIEYLADQDDLVLIRFNIETKLGKSDDGWYIDNLNILTSPISVEENSIEPKIVMYPNPAREFIEIKTNNVEKGLRPVLENIEIYDVLGRRHTLENLTPALSQGEGVIRLDVSHLQPGIYFVRVGDEMLKFVKM